MLAPLPKTRLRICNYNHEQAVKIAGKIVDRSGLALDLDFSLTARTGAPRRASWRTLMIVFVSAAILRSTMLLSHVELTANELWARRLLPVPVSYDQLWDGLHHIATALDNGLIVTAHTHPLLADPHTGLVDDCPPGCVGGRMISRELFAARLCTAAAFPNDEQPRSTAFALDSTDLETWAARRSWAREPDVDTSQGEEIPADAHSDPSFTTPGWPRIGHDGRLQHSIDPDAREGYRSGKGMRRKDVFLGFDEHIITHTSQLGAEPIPHVALGLVTAPAGSSKAAAGLIGLDALREVGHDVKDVLVDRGYSYLKQDAWALQLRARGMEPTHDLHTNQRGVRPGPIPHTVWIDGTVFVDCMPEKLQNLAGFSLRMTPAQKAELHAEYDKRAAYAFGTMGDRDPVTGAQRFRGPALRGTVRCPNYPPSMRKGFDRPTMTCEKNEPCACAKTFTLQATDYARERQQFLWGTTEWAASYARRVAIESLNAELRTNRGIHLHRGYIRSRGAAKNHLLMAFTLTGLNVRILRDWWVLRLLPDPWLVEIGDTSDPDWAEAHAHLTRRPRHMSLHERRAQQDIPRSRSEGALRGTQQHRRQARAAKEATRAKAAPPNRDEPTSGPPDKP